jgi:uncharacterized membrane protein
MHTKAAITVNRSREDVRLLWESEDFRPPFISRLDAQVTFVDAPGDRGTEIHVDLAKEPPGGRFVELLQGLVSAAPLAKVKDDLRRFKQRVETGEIPRSDGTPEGERLERKLKQHPAQPLTQAELEEVGV